MDLAKVQLSELMHKHAERENVFHDLLEMMLENMMVAERSEFLRTLPSNKGNVYRPGHGYGHGCKLEFCIPRDRYANFHPQILAILHDQVAEWLNRSLDSYYPILFVDCVHIKIHRKGMVLSALTPLSGNAFQKLPCSAMSYLSAAKHVCKGDMEIRRPWLRIYGMCSVPVKEITRWIWHGRPCRTYATGGERIISLSGVCGIMTTTKFI